MHTKSAGGRHRTGRVNERPTTTGVQYSLRVTDQDGDRHQYVVGHSARGYTRQAADRELAYVVAAIERGDWQPPKRTPKRPANPTFADFAQDWFATNSPSWRPNTIHDYGWQLEHHLLPYFGPLKLTDITVAEVDAYRTDQVAEGRIGGKSINATITRLGQILDVAEERELIPRKPVRVRPKARKLRLTPPKRPYLDSTQHIAALVDAAGAMDAEARADRQGLARRAIVCTLVFAGLRVGELLDLRWRDVDLAAGRLTVADAKTPAGRRHVELLPVLRDELAAWKARAPHAGPDDHVFATASGQPNNRHNIRERVIKQAAQRATAAVVADGGVPLPHLTPHALRRTFASLLLALGRDPMHVMQQIGHTDANLTLRLYAHVMRQGDDERARLRAIVEGDPMPAAGDAAQTPSRIGA